MNVETLERALAEIGLHGIVEVRGSLAVLRMEDAPELADEELRSLAVEAAERNGFTHLALEIDDADRRAAVHRD
ncbi:MAG TPA: hypothetical protein VFU01_03785 [Gemmatimonadaceae bacterium]|nr:hypothetical protein [Gemmatimonadaceae bacterium]